MGLSIRVIIQMVVKTLILGLEREGKRIACDISLTSIDKQELSNIEKCLIAGYEKIILCSPEKRTLDKVKTLVWQKLKESDKEKVLFFPSSHSVFIVVYIATPNISTSLVSIKEGFYQYIFLITSLFVAMEFW